MARRSLLDLFWLLGARPYNWMYRRGAPWESAGPRPALVELCTSGRITPGALAPGRAIDLGCGSGADSIFLAKRGFTVTGVDFSSVAIEKASLAAESASLNQQPRFVVADLMDLPADVGGPFDLLFDGGTLDDFPPRLRQQIAEVLTRVSRPGSVLVMWCFYAPARDLPRMTLGGASRWGAPPILPGEEVDLFGRDWVIERYHPTDSGPHEACFVMTRR